MCCWSLCDAVHAERGRGVLRLSSATQVCREVRVVSRILMFASALILSNA